MITAWPICFVVLMFTISITSANRTNIQAGPTAGPVANPIAH